jgi:hypothetical protein
MAPPLFVHIIESPSAQDLYDDRTEGRVLSAALRLAEIPTRYRLATDKCTFEHALGLGIAEGIREHRAVPLVHISSHGNNDGIGLTDGSVFTWGQLGNLLEPVNNGLEGGLILCLSCCSGAFGGRMAMREGRRIPLHTLVGHMSSPTWSSAAVAFVAFYYRLFGGASIATAVDAMKAASGDDGFITQDGQQLQESWTQHIQRLGIAEPLQRAAEIIEAARLSAAEPPIG